MDLSKFPRPADDNGRGVHWSPSTSVWGKENFEAKWLPFLEEAQIKWVKMMDDGGGSSFELVKWLVSRGIMPIVRMYIHPNYPSYIGGQHVDYAKRLADAGAPYVEFGNEPDLALEWRDGQRPVLWLEIVVNRYIDAWDKTHAFGTIPLFDAFGPGGRGNPFAMIAERGRYDVLDCMAIALHNYCLGRPLTYPNDGIADKGIPYTQEEYDALMDEDWGIPPTFANYVEPWRWVWERTLEDVNAEIIDKANPDITVLEDSTGFRAFEYIDHLFYTAAGFHAPIMITEGGYSVGQRAGTTAGDDYRYPKPTNRYMSTQTIKAVDLFPVPDYLFGQCNWFVAGYQMGVFSAEYEPQGPHFTNWYDELFSLDGELDIVQLYKDNKPRLQADGPVPVQWMQYDQPPSYAGRNMDDKLVLLDPKIDIIEFADEGEFWWVSSVQYDPTGSGYVFVKCLDETGQPIEGVEFIMLDPYGNTYMAATKGTADNYWGNLQFNGQPAGTFNLAVAGNSDTVINLGNIQIDEKLKKSCAFFITFQKKEGDSMTWEWAETFDFKALDNDDAGHSPLNEAVDYGVKIDNPHVTAGQEYWKVIGVKHLTPEENSGRHNVYAALYDDEDIYLGEVAAVPNAIGFTWNGRQDNPDLPDYESANPVELKAAPERGNIAMHWGQNVTVWGLIDGLESGKVLGMNTAHPDERPGTGNTVGHHSFYCVLKRVKADGRPPVDPPVEPPIESDCDECQQELVATKKQLEDAEAALATAQEAIDQYFGKFS